MQYKRYLSIRKITQDNSRYKQPCFAGDLYTNLPKLHKFHFALTKCDNYVRDILRDKRRHV